MHSFTDTVMCTFRVNISSWTIPQEVKLLSAHLARLLPNLASPHLTVVLWLFYLVVLSGRMTNTANCDSSYTPIIFSSNGTLKDLEADSLSFFCLRCRTAGFASTIARKAGSFPRTVAPPSQAAPLAMGPLEFAPSLRLSSSPTLVSPFGTRMQIDSSR